MKRAFIQYYRSIMALVLLVFAGAVLVELAHRGALILVGFAVLVLGWILAKKVLHHYAHGHTHEGDSVIDIAPLGVVIVANTIHPAIDGLALVETTHLAGMTTGLLFGLSILLHEVLRQSALITGLKMMRMQPLLIIGTAVLGFVIGVTLGVSGNNLLAHYELGADLLTLFSYGFVVAELV